MALSLPWKRCLAAFLQEIYDHSGSELSWRSYESYLKLFLAHCDKTPDQVTRTDVLNFIQSPSARGGDASAATKNQRRSIITSFYKFASQYEVDGVPLWQKAIPTQGMRALKSDLKYRAMNTSELKRFFAVIPNTLKGIRDRALFLTYFATARRRAEIAKLRWGDIEPTILVEEDGTRRAGFVYRYYSKGRARQIKTAELPVEAYQAINRYLEAAGRLHTIEPDELIFVSTKPDQENEPLAGDYINQMFKHYASCASLDTKRLSVHSLRHTAAHLRRKAGQDILLIKELLGHASLDTTYRYLVVMEGVADAGAKLLSPLFAHLNQLSTTS